MDDGDKIGVIDFGIVYFLTDETSNSLFDMMFLSLKSDQNIKHFYTILKITIRLICFDERQHKTIFEILKNDKDFELVVRYSHFRQILLLK